MSFTVANDHPIRVEATDDNPLTLINRGDTFYYGQTSSVSSTSNDGSVSNGGSLSLTIPTWIKSASVSFIDKLSTPPSSDPSRIPAVATATLSANASVGDTSITVNQRPGVTYGYVAIDPWTSNCEVRAIVSVSGNRVNFAPAPGLAGLSKAHGAITTSVYFFTGSEVPYVWWGAPTDGVTSASAQIQAAHRSLLDGLLARTIGGLRLTGGGNGFQLDKPVMIPSLSFITSATFAVKSSFTPADTNGAAMMTFRGNPQAFTATAADDTFTTRDAAGNPVAHGMIAGSQVVHKATTGSLPGGVTENKVYWVNPITTTTYKLYASGSSGAALDLSSDGVGDEYPDPQALCRIWLRNFYLLGHSSLPTLNGLRANLQQPGSVLDARFDKFARGLWLGGAGNPNTFGSLQFFQCGVGLALDNATLFTFPDLNAEQCTVAGVKVLDATEGTMGGGGATDVSFPSNHFELDAGTFGFDVKGPASLHIGEVYGGGGGLVWKHTGESGTTIRIDGPIDSNGTTGDYVIKDDDNPANNRTIPTGRWRRQFLELAGTQSGDHTGDDEDRYEIILAKGGYHRWGAVNPASHKRVSRPSSDQTGDQDRWLDKSGNVVTSIDKDGNLLAAAPWQDIASASSVGLATTLNAAGTFIFSAPGGITLPSAGTAGVSPFSFDPAWYVLPGQSLKLRCIWGLSTNDIAPASNFTFGLYPVTAVGGAANIVSVTLGTVVTGTTLLVTTPNADTITGPTATSEITVPSAGLYVLGFVLSAAVAANSRIVVRGRVQVRNT